MNRKTGILFFCLVFLACIKSGAQNRVSLINNSSSIVSFKLSTLPDSTFYIQAGGSVDPTIGSYQQCQIYIPTYKGTDLINSVTYNINAMPSQYQIYWNSNDQKFDLVVMQKW